MRIKFIKNIVNVLRGKKVEKWVGNSILIDDQGKLKKYHGKRIKVSIAGNNNEIILNKYCDVCISAEIASTIPSVDNI